MNKTFIQKISLAFLLFMVPVFGGLVYGQDTKVTISLENVPMEKVMNEIEKQTNYLFGSTENVDINRLVTVKVQNSPLKTVLEAMLKDSGVTYVIEGTNILLKVGGGQH